MTSLVAVRDLPNCVLHRGPFERPWLLRSDRGQRQRVRRADGVGVNLKKIIIVLVVAFVLFFLISQPTESANVVTNVLGWLKQGAEAIITFVKSLFA